MQTFLPYPSFADSARVLDRQRLGKQRVENLQIMKALLVPGAGWANHPAVMMWYGYEFQFLMYQTEIVSEWEARGYKDTCLPKTVDLYIEHYQDPPFRAFGFPPWLGDEDFHASHQSNLVRKDPEHYRQFFETIPDDLPYLWPTREE